MKSWEDRIELLDARAKRARAQAAQRLEPTAVRISLDSATLKTKEDAEAYIDDMRGRIMKHIDEGNSVII